MIGKDLSPRIPIRHVLGNVHLSFTCQRVDQPNRDHRGGTAIACEIGYELEVMPGAASW